MRFSSIAWKHLRRRPLRTALAASGIAVAVATVVTVVGVAHRFQASFIDLYSRRGIDLVVVRAGAMAQLTGSLDESLLDRVRELPNVRTVAAELLEVLSFDDLDLFGVTVQGWPTDCFLFDRLKLTAGEPLAGNGGRGVLLGSTLAESLHKRVGDQLELVENEMFQVHGVFESQNPLENGAIVAGLGDLQDVLQRPGQLTSLTVVVDKPDDAAGVDRLRAAIESLEPGVAAMPASDYVASSAQIRIARAMALVTSVIAIVASVIAVLNTMIMTVYERTAELGILRAVGWPPRRIVSAILLESLYLSLIGGVLGATIALVVVRLLLFLPAAAVFLDGTVAPVVIAYGLATALLVGLAGGAYPARYAARLLPTEALRHE